MLVYMNMQYFHRINIYVLLLSLSALLSQAVTCSDRQDCVVAPGAVSAQDGNADRFCLHCRTAHTLLLQSSLLQGVHGLTVTFALRERQTVMTALHVF